MQQPPSWSGAAAVGSRSTPPRAMTRTAAALMGDMGGHTQGDEIDYRTKVVKEVVQTEQHYVTMLKRLVSVSSPSPLPAQALQIALISQYPNSSVSPPPLVNPPNDTTILG